MDKNDLEKNADKANESKQSVIKYLVDCLYVYQQGDDDALGYFGYVLSKSFCNEDSSSPSGFTPTKRYESMIKRVREAKNTNCVLSTMGGSWEEDYKDVDPDDYDINFGKETKSGKNTKKFIKAGGRDNPFPVDIRENNKGQWKIMGGLSTMCMDVRRPKSEEGDF